MASGEHLLPSIGCILAPLETDSPFDAIEQLANGLGEFFGPGDVMRISATAIARESLASTFIGHDTAIPHARLAQIDRFAFGIGIPASPISWGPEHQPARLVFLSVVPNSASTAYLQFMRQIAQLVKDEQARLQMLANPTPESVRYWLTSRLALS